MFTSQERAEDRKTLPRGLAPVRGFHKLNIVYTNRASGATLFTDRGVKVCVCVCVCVCVSGPRVPPPRTSHEAVEAGLENSTEATHMPQNFPALRAGISHSDSRAAARCGSWYTFRGTYP